MLYSYQIILYVITQKFKCFCSLTLKLVKRKTINIFNIYNCTKTTRTKPIYYFYV
jgi:hypothetical protein